VKPNHAANCELVRRISAQLRKALVTAQTFAPPPEHAGPSNQAGGTPGQEEGAMDMNAIFAIVAASVSVPHGGSGGENRGHHICGIKNVTANEPYFQGHFPGHPIMPGVLQLEAIAQVAGILMFKRAETGARSLISCRRGCQMAQTGAAW